jgi:prepilin-type N-terminal cleavage/methylation domain-containing protein
MNRKGFTLIELVIVIVIIGILAAVAIPKFISLKNEANRAVCQSNVGAIRTALSNFYAKCNINNTACPDSVACNVSICFPDSGELNYNSATPSNFSKSYFSEGNLPNNDSMSKLNINGNWGDSGKYDSTTGIMNMTACCGS